MAKPTANLSTIQGCGFARRAILASWTVVALQIHSRLASFSAIGTRKRKRGLGRLSVSPVVLFGLWNQLQAFMSRQLQSGYRYIHLAVSPPGSDALTLRKGLQDALMQSFGVMSATYLDVLWVAEDGARAVVRVREECVHRVSNFHCRSSTMIIPGR